MATKAIAVSDTTLRDIQFAINGIADALPVHPSATEDITPLQLHGILEAMQATLTEIEAEIEELRDGEFEVKVSRFHEEYPEDHEICKKWM